MYVYIFLNFPAHFFFQANGAGGVKKGQLLLGHNRGRMEKSNSSGGGCMSEPEFFESNQQGRPSKARSEQRIGKKYALKRYDQSDLNNDILAAFEEVLRFKCDSSKLCNLI